MGAHASGIDAPVNAPIDGRVIRRPAVRSAQGSWWRGQGSRRASQPPTAQMAAEPGIA